MNKKIIISYFSNWQDGNTNHLRNTLLLILLFLGFIGCKKFVEVDELKDSLLATQVFDNDATANSAILGIYSNIGASLTLPINCYASLSSDDIGYYGTTSDLSNFQNNTILSSAGISYNPWSIFYSIIYQSNAAIEGLNASTGVSQSNRAKYIGEAKFLRAYSYFYLVNFFGDVPLLTSTDVNINSIAMRTSANQVYAQIIADLSDAQTSLPADYSLSSSNKTRANKWAATALLARVYLYQQNWIKAEAQAAAVINAGLYSLLNKPAGIFSKNNNEAILQWDRYSGQATFTLPTYFIWTAPSMACTTFLLNAFESGDLRKNTWIKSNGTYNCPYKFTTTSTTALTEFETPFRLAEQYLIRAEARAMQNNFQGAIDDINLIRLNHGGLSTYLNAPASQTSAMDIIMRERQVDLFTEDAHRWFDLKRTGRLNTVMQGEKSITWKSMAALWPIPASEILLDPNLTQNPGYN